MIPKVHYLVGSEGDAGSIVKRFLQKSGANVIYIDDKLESNFPTNIDPGNYLYIETPPKTHAKYIQFGRDHGLHIFVEKPLVYSITELTEVPPLFCNLNMEFLSISPKGISEISRFCQKMPGYLQPGDRGVILDLVPHLLSIFAQKEIESMRIVGVQSRKENDIDIFSSIFFSNNIVMIVGYGLNNYIGFRYQDKSLIELDWLPEESWWYNIRRFWLGVTNSEKAFAISKKIEEIYNTKY